MIQIKELLINGTDYSDYATIPLQTQNTLDESLDVAYIELKGIEINNPFTPFSDVYLKIQSGDVEKEEYLLIESDTVIEVIANKTYNHNVLLIEETKWAERFFVEKSITNPLYHDYISYAKGLDFNSIYDFTSNNMTVGSFLKENLDGGFIYSPAKVNTTFLLPHKIFNDADILDWRFDGGTITIISPNGEEKQIQLEDNGVSEIIYNQLGVYKYYFNYYLRSSTLIETMYAYARFYFDVEVIEQEEEKDPKTIKDTINILLQSAETLRQSEKPIFRLADLNEYNESEEYKTKVKKILETKSPEFYFAKMSLFEALKTVGNYSHFIPRIRDRKVYLDLLGNEEQIEVLEDYCSNTKSQNTNEFCSKLDSQIDNLVNLDDDEQGSVISPFNAGYRTLRAESGVAQITEENIIIPTENPIEKIVKLEIGFIDGIDKEIGDITAYVYEDAEYQALSSYSNAFPYSKMFALKYTQGQPNITGLTFERADIISDAFESLAITNIINKRLNITTSRWNNLFDKKDAINFQYRITYIPSTSTRVTQSKAYTKNITKSVSIAYNQSASKVSSNAYGENLKGQVLKMGNAEINKMFLLPSIDLIPKCGYKFDKDYYISTVKCEYYPNFIKCELGLSKDFNNKNAYIEVDSQIRFYEISEKMAVDIYKIYEDYCEIGFDSESDNKSLITSEGLDKFTKCFEYDYSGTPLSMVNTISLNEENKVIKTLNKEDASFIMPVISLGIGNSLLFEYHYKDNFGAGEIAISKDGGKFQENVRYTDDSGEIEYLSLKYGINKTIPTTYENAVEMGDNLPLNAVDNMEVYFDTLDDNIVLKKDNREAIHFTYQIHFVSNNDNIIIGSGLAKHSPFVTSETQQYKLYLIKDKINKFENEIDLTNATLCDNIFTTIDYENKKVKLNNVIAPLSSDEWKSWVIVQTYKNKNDLIIGENKNIKSGDTIQLPTFVFKHRIVED